MSALAMLATDELQSIEMAERQGKRSAIASHIPPTAAYSYANAGNVYIPGARQAAMYRHPYASSTQANPIEQPPGCEHADCHRTYNEHVAASLQPLHHGGSSNGGIHSYQSSKSFVPYSHRLSSHAYPSNPSSVPSSREHSPHFSPNDSAMLMSDDYPSDGEPDRKNSRYALPPTQWTSSSSPYPTPRRPHVPSH